jgi:hypothetical protein
MSLLLLLLFLLIPSALVVSLWMAIPTTPGADRPVSEAGSAPRRDRRTAAVRLAGALSVARP